MPRTNLDVTVPSLSGKLAVVTGASDGIGLGLAERLASAGAEVVLPVRNPAKGKAELARVDALLDDEAFFAPFRAYFDPVFGRPSIPTETYLRLMFLKFRHRLGYESVCAEVADSISWRRFCRLGIDGRVPHPTTAPARTTGRDLGCGHRALCGAAAGECRGYTGH